MEIDNRSNWRRVINGQSLSHFRRLTLLHTQGVDIGHRVELGREISSHRRHGHVLEIAPNKCVV